MTPLTKQIQKYSKICKKNKSPDTEVPSYLPSLLRYSSNCTVSITPDCTNIGFHLIENSTVILRGTKTVKQASLMALTMRLRPAMTLMFDQRVNTTIVMIEERLLILALKL